MTNLGARLLSIAGLLVLAGCRNESKNTQPSPEVVAESVVSAAPSVAATPSSAPPQPIAIAAFPSRKVEAKTLTDGSTIGEFTFERKAGDEGLVWNDAADHCARMGLHLCTSTQWQVACEADPAIAEVETWTMTPERTEGFVVRGGSKDGCRDNRVAMGVQASPFRTAACCSPALAASGRNIMPAMLRAMVKNVLDLERTMNTRRASALRDFFDDPIKLYTKERTRSDAVSVYEFEFGKYRDFQVIHEVCDFSTDETNQTYTGDCRKIARQGGLVGHVLTRYVFVAGVGKIRSITDPAVYRQFVAP